MTDTIEGFKLQVTSEELKTHLEKRLAHHANALEKLQGNKIQLIGAQGNESMMISEHKKMVRILSYVTSHIPEGAVYRLTLHELQGMWVLDELANEEE